MKIYEGMKMKDVLEGWKFSTSFIEEDDTKILYIDLYENGGIVPVRITENEVEKCIYGYWYPKGYQKGENSFLVRIDVDESGYYINILD